VVCNAKKTITMKNRIIILISILTMISGICLAQQTNDKIKYIAFKFEHSRRIPNHNIIIEVIKRQSEIVVKVKSNPMNSNTQWEKTKVDTTFSIDSKKFIELANDMSILNKIDLNKALTGGLDGTECYIEFGQYGSTVAYKFWSPDCDTKQRGLSDFLNLCEKLIKVGGLKPEDIL
ncbi:hypothetical protein ACE01N_20660, partial [Saccharicrinis sp. FJH2]|uniref:hypothetical protein n=1 Tax=Saccharicrinis sp. FJH65 TaxID=3344659 RepID=UPI0035F32AC3